MKPVDKGPPVAGLTDYSDAKPELLLRLGRHCSYCEQPGSPQDLHVEHIYPKDPHPELRNEWENFLVACNTCNTYKHLHQRSVRQVDLENRYVWPHIDNTLLSFDYFDDGRIEVNSILTGATKQAAKDTLEMIGAMKSPTVASAYDEDIAYDGMAKRKEIWSIIMDERHDYLDANGRRRPTTLARSAAKMGHFSIWMKIFHDRPEVRTALIQEFRAASSCFSPDGQPISRGRI